jgi:hypothetical protein
MEKIDFVITWVDGADPAWLAEKQKYQKTDIEISSGDANAECRYRSETELLRYWFRGVEKFAPWVNKIYFVTCGQKPEWLNESHIKLKMINHRDYIVSKYLPTYNSNAIELNYHRMEDLSEEYVMFNDDIFLLQSIGPEYFFRNGNPVLDTDLRYYKKVGLNNWSKVAFNNYCVVNMSFDMRRSIWENRKKWFNVKELGWKRSMQNIACFMANKTLPFSIYGHIAQPHLKSTLQEVWEKWNEVMDITSSHKFRSDDQVNQWLLCSWNQAKGRFYPTTKEKRGININVSPDMIKRAVDIIKNQLVPQVCLNDSEKNINAEFCNAELIKAFDTILPNKSSFEK